MYGIINKAIEDLVTEKYGTEEWEAVKEKSKVEVDFFISNETYDDAITFDLVRATAQVLGMSMDQVLFALGEWWVLRTLSEKYGDLMEAGGKDLKSFLLNLPMVYNRILLMYPKLTPPEFKISDVSEKSILVHYHSQRVGLRELVRGALSGLAKKFQAPVQIDFVQAHPEGNKHDVFKISW